MLWLVVLIVVVALAFDFVNGMNDAANSIATVVSTRVLTPKQAVAWAAFWNFAAWAFFGTAVAKTIVGVVDPAQQSLLCILSGLTGAVAWAHTCTKLGLPISVSHSLIGGMIGAALVKAGWGSLNGDAIRTVVIFIFAAPLIGLLVGAALMLGVYWLFHRQTPARVDRLFRGGQLVSSAAFSLGHGGNDAQKTAGIITIALYTAGYQSDKTPIFWVVLAAYAAIGLWTLMGGWSVIRTMGSKLTKLRPEQGFCAEMAGAVVLMGTAKFGIPASTTHSITGSIMGVGTVKRMSAVRWGVATKILWAWVLTIPAAGAVSAVMYWLLDVTTLTSLAPR